MLNQLYRSNLGLLTDLYQLTMAYSYWKAGMHDREAVFYLSFRTPPFKGKYTLAAGQGLAAAYLNNWQFSTDDIQYLGGLKGEDEKALFDESFLNYLQRLTFSCDVDVVPEGTVVFPHQPLLRVKGPILQAQLLETPLLNLINFSTLIATKAARVSSVANGPVLEFGLRRAQGIDGGLTAARAAFIGGCAATSNMLAGKMLGIPVKGTHAHSWVMAFDEELESFYTFARAMPNNCIFLVDTYDTQQGIEKAIEVAHWLEKQGKKMLGVRLDSGDLVSLSQYARRRFDEEGFNYAKVYASNSLDEYRIRELQDQGAQIAVWGVGTRLVCAYDEPALGGVYKLSALRGADGKWQHKVKISENPAKSSLPGHLQVHRCTRQGKPVQDLLYDELDQPELPEGAPLLQAFFKQGKFVGALPTIAALQNKAVEEWQYFNSLSGNYDSLREENLEKRFRTLTKMK